MRLFERRVIMSGFYFTNCYEGTLGLANIVTKIGLTKDIYGYGYTARESQFRG